MRTVCISGLPGESELEVAGTDGADVRVAIARRSHLDPGAPEVRRSVGIVGGDLDEGDLVRVVPRTVVARVGHLDRLDGEPPLTQDAHALDRLHDRELVARGMVQ